MINRDLKKRRNKPFTVRCKHTSEIEKDLTNETNKQANKQKQFFLNLSILQICSRFGLLQGKFQAFFHEFKTLYEPTVNENEEGEAGGIKTCAVDASSSKGCVNHLRRVGRFKCSCCSVTVGCAKVGDFFQGTGLLSLQI